MRKDSKIVDLSIVKDKKRKLYVKQLIDLRASVVILEECYKLLSINNLRELVEIKSHILKTLIKLEKTLESHEQK